MTWHYAVAIRHDGTHQVVEAYWGDDDKLFGWAEISIQGEDMKEVRRDLASVRRAVAAGPLYRITKSGKIKCI